ncbi:glycosyltransferase family 87 protein [Danxiaibacter flavus]|uniref:Glycosyltransferase family 87 protein n=1 Tax=Danxiaibacter flavus TaxID=3049108 RepID=A0ABV3ZKW9_9BACT|nr:glycosyltransferase family 87 protein [Chitinophagaceae bacterium DXS]
MSTTINKFLAWIRSGAFLKKTGLAIALWFGLSLIAVMLNVRGNTLNNFIIFKHVYLHTIQQTNLYIEYPQQYSDVNLYGPFFSIVMAPFSFLPDKAGVILWVLLNVSALYYAIRDLPVEKTAQNTILILSSHEMMTASSWLQSNGLTAACIILTFTSLHKGKEGYAAFYLLLATFIKIYGIVGLAFFFFSGKPLRFIAWLIVWSIVFFTAPMLISSADFILQSYGDWKQALIQKSAKNIRLDIHNDYQDISMMGLIRRIFFPALKDSFVIIPALIAFATQYMQYRFFNNTSLRLYILCSVLLFTVIFSTGSESPTYIIAFPAVCLWYILQPKNAWANAMLVFALLLTSFSYSDIFTPWVRTHIARPYALKALPCCILWITIIVQIHKRQFLHAQEILKKELSPA